MSIKAMNWAWCQVLEPAPKLVLLALADIADDNGLAWPSINHLADKVCVSRRTVQRILRELETRSSPLVQVRPQRAENGRQRANAYRLLLPAMEGVNLTPSPRNEVGEGVSSGVVRVTELRHGEGATAGTPEGGTAMSSLEPPYAPPEEPKIRTTRPRPGDKSLSPEAQRAIARELARLAAPVANELMGQLATGLRNRTIRSPAAWVKAAADRLTTTGVPQ